MAGGRSQRHKVLYQGVASNGESEASGVGGGDLGPSPSVSSLSPNTAVVGSPQLTLDVAGANFTASTVIVWNGGDEPTTFVDAGLVQTIVDPSTASGPAVVPVGVRTGSLSSNTLPFSFTATELE